MIGTKSFGVILISYPAIGAGAFSFPGLVFSAGASSEV